MSPVYFPILIDEFITQDEHLERKVTSTPNAELQEPATKPNTNECRQICLSPIIITTTHYEDDEDDTSNAFGNVQSFDKEQNSILGTESNELVNENQMMITESSEVQIVEVRRCFDANAITIWHVIMIAFLFQDHR